MFYGWADDLILQIIAEMPSLERVRVCVYLPNDQGFDEDFAEEFVALCASASSIRSADHPHLDICVDVKAFVPDPDLVPESYLDRFMDPICDLLHEARAGIGAGPQSVSVSALLEFDEDCVDW